MDLLKDKKAVLKFSFLTLALIAIVAIIVYAGGVFAATHTSTADLEPEWSTPGVTNNYDAKICNTGGDSIDEVRILQNPNYQNLNCDEKTDWTLVEVSGFPDPELGPVDMCWYYTDDDHAIPEGNCETFKFEADAPTTDPQECFLTWKFETRDIKDFWRSIYDTTNIDSEAPLTTKSFIGPQKTEMVEGNLVEWIDGVTLVDLNAEDLSQECGIGVNETYYKNKLMEDLIKEHKLEFGSEEPCWDEDICEGLAEISEHIGEFDVYNEPFEKEGESCHVLWYYSVDELGNVEDVQTNCFFVDTTPPTGTKEVGEPKIPLCDYRDITESWDIYNVKEANTGDIYNINDYPKIFDGPLHVEAITHSDGTVEFVVNVPVAFVDGSQDNVAFTFDADNDGEADFQLSYHANINSHYSGEYWGYQEVISSSWSGWQSLPVEFSVSATGNKIFSVSFSASLLGDCGSEYKFGVAGSYAGSGTNGQINPGANIHFQFPEDFGWGPNWVESNDYHLNYVGGLKDWWVRDHVTPITLTCEDQLPHPSGDEEVCYKVSYDLDPHDLTSEYCDADLTTINEGSEYDGEWCCVPASETIIFEEDSLHDLEYFCRDAVDKKSEIDLEWFRVDSQPPIIEKHMFGSYLGDCPEGTYIDHSDCYVADDGTSGVNITVYDNQTYQGCAVDEVWCEYELWWEGQNIDSGSFGEEGKDIIFTRDSTHMLYIHCEDALGNVVEDNEEFLVDSTPPVTTKTYEGPHYPDPIVEGQYPHWITSETPITLTADDEKVGVDKTYWRNTLLNDNKYCESYASGDCIEAIGIGDFVEYTGSFTKPEESCHLIEYYSVDKLGNTEETKRQCVYVDNTPPEANKIIQGPELDAQEPVHKYLTSDSSVYINCTDQDPHPVGEEILHWEMYWKEDNCEIDDNWGTAIGSGDEATGDKIFTGLKDSCHKFVYWCSDILGNVEPAPHEEIDIVDNKAPRIEIEVVGPQFGEYIDGVTEIYVNAIDPEPHPVDNVQCEWGYNLDSGEWFGWYNTFPIIFPEETQHDLMIKCWDALGNGLDDSNWYRETFYVDKTPPSILKRYGEPYYFYEDDGWWAKWISSETPIYGSVTDAGDHKSGIKEVKYRTTRVADDDCKYYDERPQNYTCDEATGDGWTIVDPTFEFNISEDSCHLIEIMATDNVDKCSLHKQWVYVDNQPPTPLKEVGVPKTVWDGANSDFYPWIEDYCWNGLGDQIECWKVTLDTEISMTCEDPTPHPVDNEIICFNVERNGEDWTESYCEEYNGNYNESEDGYCCLERTIENFTFLGSCEHNLKFYCEDALGNKGPIDEEKFKVEGNDFEIQINKKWNLISVPVVLLSDNISEVFEDIANDIESVWAYDAKLDEWYVYTPDGNDFNDNLHELIPGWGYWVLATDDTTLVIGGSLLAPGITPPSRNLVEGWNLIGYYGIKDKNGTNVQEYDGPNLNGDGQEKVCALGTLCGPLWFEEWGSVVTYWQPTSNPWVYLEGRYDYMNPGAGYWVFMRDNGEYSKATGCCSFLGS